MNIARTFPVRSWLTAATVAMAVAMAGCSDATPLEAGRAEASRGPSTTVGTIVPAGPAAPSTPVPPGAGGSSGSDGSTTGGATTGGAGDAGSTEPTEPSRVEPSPGVPGQAPPPAEAAPPVAGDPGERHPQPWDGSTVGADGLTITFTYYAGIEPCSVFDSIVAE
ncbi:MAG: hypothetical protein QOD63_279, partial [Actinomycetota bacterium]|nr:hypothetical protein [Actinomycetota bacterium]